LDSLWIGAKRKGGTLVRIAVIDGQGGAIGSTIVKRIRQAIHEKVELWALGTNVIATTQMMKAGANRGASGENAICRSVEKVDLVTGTISILISNALMGELTPAMAEAIGSCSAHKLLLPLTQEAVTIVGPVPEPLPHLVDKLISEHLAPLLAAMNGATVYPRYDVTDLGAPTNHPIQGPPIGGTRTTGVPLPGTAGNHQGMRP
jgi:hypothetical protein